MKKLNHIFLLIFFLLGIVFLTPSWASTVRVETIFSQDKYEVGGNFPILFRLQISKSWYIHTSEQDAVDYLIPTTLTFSDSPSLRINNIQFPTPQKKQFDYAPNATIEVFSNDILVKANLVVAPDAKLGEQNIKGKLTYQACSLNLCLPPEEIPINITVSVIPKGEPVNQINQDLFLLSSQPIDKQKVSEKWLGKGFGLTIFLFFLAGLGLNLTPCIYPLIPITVSYFGGKTVHSKRRVAHGFLYIIGIAVTNSLLGVSAALSGEMLGAVLRNPVILYFIALVLTALGLSFFGLWEFQVPALFAHTASKTYRGYFGTFFMGLSGDTGIDSEEVPIIFVSIPGAADDGFTAYPFKV